MTIQNINAMTILINRDLFKTKDAILKARIERAHVIDYLLCEIEAITIAMNKNEATGDEIARLDDLHNRLLPNATNAFRLHMEGSGSLVRAYNGLPGYAIQTIARDFLRTIQMVKPFKN